MLKLKAEVSCDRARCDKKAEVDVFVTLHGGLPLLSYELPTGWGQAPTGHGTGEVNYLCEEHYVELF